MNKTLYVSDLDGTLLQSNEKISKQTCDIINSLVKQGMIFSYATARSFHTAAKVTYGLTARFPLIVYNGAFIIDNQTCQRMVTNTFSSEEKNIIYEKLVKSGISPIVYSLIDDTEKFSYDTSVNNTKGMLDFLNTRKGDFRDNPLSGSSQILNGNVFYFTCIDYAEKLLPVYTELKGDFNCVYQKDIYSGEQWLEIMPKKATKANAILQLKDLYGCNQVISFGDGINDIPMFNISNESYAVQNACKELKQIASGVIASNDSDGVAKWLKSHFTQ